ncbi:MAG: putative phosphatase [Candidatus Celerinatantimonas neptuna]|nr:MAG: putative phosphatase [Candidatus Celerinatantimonas neptuna]
MPNSLTIFDLDDTLLNGDTMALWHQYLCDRQLIDDPITFLEQDNEFDKLYRAGQLDIQTYLHFSLEPLQHIDAATVDSMVQTFIEERVKPRLYSEADGLIHELQEHHHYLLVISATVDFIVRPVAQLLGIQNVLAVNVTRQHGCYTSQIIGTPSFRDGKIIRLQQWLTDQPWTPDELRFYTDSINDLPLLEQVDHPYVVNPAQTLLEIAQKRNWTILDWNTTNTK